MKPFVRLSLYAVRVTFALGCSPAPAAVTSTEPCPLGDLSQPPEVSVVIRTADGRLEEVQSGARVPLIEPPQGGQVVFVGVRARNVDGCGLIVTAALQEPGADHPLAIDARAIDLVAGQDGWGEPKTPGDISGFANIPACPAAGATRDVEGQPHVLVVTAQDRAKRVARATLEVVPTCSQPELAQLCASECRAGAGRAGP